MIERQWVQREHLEKEFPREKHDTIELSDREHADRMFVKFNSNATALLNNGTVGVIVSEPPPIPMKLEMPELEKAIREGKKNAKGKSKSPKRKPKKNNSQPHAPAVETVQD